MFKTHDSWQPFQGLPSLSLYDILLPFSPPATLDWTSGRKWMDRKIAQFKIKMFNKAGYGVG